MAQRSGTIVGVDDDPSSLRLLKDLIEEAGYTFFGAPSGQECLGLLHRVKPKVILLDIMMPDMDGYETCQRIRKQFASVRAPVIFVTALNQAADVRRGLDSGGNDFVVKPFERAKLIQRVDHWARKGL